MVEVGNVQTRGEKVDALLLITAANASGGEGKLGRLSHRPALALKTRDSVRRHTLL